MPSSNTPDARWRIADPYEPIARMPRIENKTGLRHKLHHTTFRETVAAEVPAMNLFEYDHLPWNFYLDMADHLEDEVRHSAMCRDLLEERGGQLGDFPLPCYGNFYAMFWQMDLPERLVALNLDTEGHGHGCLVEMSQRMIGVGDTSASELFASLADDEQRHAAIGGRWLKYLVPQEKRRDVLDAVRSLLFLSLASAETREGHELVADVLERWERCGSPLTYLEPFGAAHESEVAITGERRVIG